MAKTSKQMREENTHVVAWYFADGAVGWVYGDNMTTNNKSEALRFSKEEAQGYAADLDRIFNTRRRAEGMPLHVFVSEEA